MRKLCDALRGDVMDNDFGLADQVRAALVGEWLWNVVWDTFD